MLITIYARREPTTDRATLEARRLVPGSYPNAMDVQLYRNADATEPCGRCTHDYSDTPTKRNKYVTVNCARYRLEWIA